MLCDTIQLLRKKNKLTQKELASKVNLTQQAIAKWERGISEPDSDTLNKLAELFGVSTDYLLGRRAFDWDLQMFAEKPAPAPSVSPEDGHLLAAYHNAPQPIRDAVDGLLAPYQKENPAGLSGEAM